MRRPHRHQPQPPADSRHGEHAVPVTDCVGLTILHAIPCDDGTATLILGWPETDELPPLPIVAMTSQRLDAYFGLRRA